MKRYHIILFLTILIIILPASVIISAPDSLYGNFSVGDSVAGSVYSSPVVRVEAGAKLENKQKKKDTIKPPANPKKFAYLTFDDGPSSTVTPKILKVLDEYNIKATFFMLGSCIEEYPSVVKSVYSKGHEIGNHTYTHRWNLVCNNFKSEITRTNKVIEKAVGGYKVGLFRSPYGYKLRASFKECLKSLGMRTYGWNVDCKDSRGRGVPADTIYNNAAWSLDNKKDVVIILHDGKGHDQTAIALPKIIKELYRKGYGIKPLTPDTKVNAKVEVK
ncbi:MAG: polysaccharide deacetylase family protein [Deltaproteobacteria bacterium]